MGCLAFVDYDPATAGTKQTDTLIAMTAIDTTNLRLTFTAPANGTVLVRIHGSSTGATTVARIMYGVMDGSVVKGRMSPIGRWTMVGSPAATDIASSTATFLVKGLTPGQSYTWDAAYGVEVVVALTNMKYGGPDNATSGDAWGSFQFEIWDTQNLLAGTLYDPAAAVTKSTTALLAMTAFDTTNLRLTFQGPSSGKVYWRIATGYHGVTAAAQILLGILDGSTIKARTAVSGAPSQTSVATSTVSMFEASGVIAVTPGTNYTWDAAYSVDILSGGGGIKYGGPDNATTNDAFGGIAFEIWRA